MSALFGIDALDGTVMKNPLLATVKSALNAVAVYGVYVRTLEIQASLGAFGAIDPTNGTGVEDVTATLNGARKWQARDWSDTAGNAIHDSEAATSLQPTTTTSGGLFGDSSWGLNGVPVLGPYDTETITMTSID